jgi:Septum formation
MAAPTGLTSGSAQDPPLGQTADPEQPDDGLPRPAEPADDAGDDGARAGPELAEAEPAPENGPAGRPSRLRGTAVVVGILALAGVAAGGLAVATHGFRPKVIVTYRPAAVFSLRPGDCVNSAPNGLDVTVLSCATPHDAEVFATFTLPASPWPGTGAVQTQAGNGCASRVSGYVNPQLASAGLAQEYVYPSQAAWQAGVRTVVCEISASSGQLTGSVRKPG